MLKCDHVQKAVRRVVSLNSDDLIEFTQATYGIHITKPKNAEPLGWKMSHLREYASMA